MTIIVVSRSEIQKTFATLIQHDMLNSRLTPILFSSFKNFDKSYLGLLRAFMGKRTILLYAWARRMQEQLDASNLPVKIHCVEMDKKNYRSLVFPTDCLISLTVNLNEFALGDLKVLITQLAGRSLQNINFTGGRHFSSKVLLDFLDKIYDAELINVADDDFNKDIKAQAVLLTHRNQLIKCLGIKKEPDIWKAIVKEWVATGNDDNNVFYIKPINNNLAPTYNEFIQPIVKKEVRVDAKINRAAVINFELITLVNACVNEMGSVFTNRMFDHLNSQSHLQHRMLVLNKEGGQQAAIDLYIKLANYLTSGKVIFDKLSLRVNPETFDLSEFKNVLIALKNSGIQGLELSFTKSLSVEEKNTITSKFKPLLNYINFPLTFAITGTQGNSLHTFGDLQKVLIEQLQKRNLASLFGQSCADEDESEDAVLTQQIDEEHNLFAQKIRLKALIKKASADVELRQDLNNYISVEVQHTEVLQQVEQVQEQVVVNARTTYLSDALDLFDGDLIGYNQFIAEPYKSSYEAIAAIDEFKLIPQNLLADEFFVSVPHNIKYFTAAAAAQMAVNLPSFATLNASNLPEKFIRKRTALGEIVLDYDFFALPRESNVYTPRPGKREQVEAMYQIKLLEKDVAGWIDNKILFTAICQHDGKFDHRKLDNLWIMYGDVGVKMFFKALNSVDKKHPEFSIHLFTHYLNYFMHWEHFLKNQDFLALLQKFNSYSAEKMQCLQKFLLNTGSSRHNLFDTVEGFEFFWSRLSQLCAEQNANINLINSEWCTPVGGNPLVYLERMQEILEGARNLSEQLSSLDGLLLDNYGPYYAVKYEGFRLVAKEMMLSINTPTRSRLGEQSFEPDSSIYRCTLESLHNSIRYSVWTLHAVRQAALSDEDYIRHNYEENHPAEDEIKTELATRTRSWLIRDAEDKFDNDKFLLLQQAGQVTPYREDNFIAPYKVYWQNQKGCELVMEVPYQHLSEKAFRNRAFRYMGLQSTGVNFQEYLTVYKDYVQRGVQVNKIMFTSLFFVTHERYSGKITIAKLFDILSGHTCHEEVSIATNKHLLEAHKRDIKLSDTEGAVLCERIARMNSSEFESSPFGRLKKEYIEKLFNHLFDNKFGVIKTLAFFASHGYNKWPFVYALDTAEYLMSDPLIAETYREDLILLGAQLNSKYKFSYYKSVDAASNNPQASALLSALLEVKSIIHKAAATPRPNNYDYSLRIIIDNMRYTDYSEFLSIFAQIDKLQTLDYTAVDAILRAKKFEINASPLLSFTRDSSDLRNIMRHIISVLYKVEKNGIQGELKALFLEADYSADPELVALNKHLLTLKTVKELQVELQARWKNTASKFLSIGENVVINSLFKRLRDSVIDDEFKSHQDSEFVNVIKSHIGKIKEFNDYNNFEKIERIMNMAANIVGMLQVITKRENYLKDEKAIIALFNNLDFKNLDYEVLFALVNLMLEMPQRGYSGILSILTKTTFLTNKPKLLEAIDYTYRLTTQDMPTSSIEKILNFVCAEMNSQLVPLFVDELIEIHKEKSEDLLLNFVINNLDLGIEHARSILSYRKLIPVASHFAMHELLIFLRAGDSSSIVSFLNELTAKPQDTNLKVFAIVAGSFITGRTKAPNVKSIDYRELVLHLNKLTNDEIDVLYSFSQTAMVSGPSLYTALRSRDQTKPFSEFLTSFEKAPFGPRNFAEQFSIAELERVVNNIKDLSNDSRYTFQYRKQLMEAALFVNAIGYDLPLYDNKAAKDLSDLEIAALIAALKAKQMAHLDPFQTVVYALGLMREAMYRATQEFPYITQIVALLDSAMHNSDVISNIDMGQGKGLVDTMKGALLWLLSDCVNITTSSLIDAKLQIAGYGPFLARLKIPYGKTTISASSDFTDYLTDGINFGTFASLSLFLSRARAEGFEIKTANNIVSLVINESDHAILDEYNTVYRYAITDLEGVSYGNEWIYTAVNEFVGSSAFVESDQVAIKDIKALRNYLLHQAQLKRKSIKLIENFNDAKLLSWIESAIIVQYGLRENHDNVIPDEPIKKIINGLMTTTHIVKILQKDGKVSPDTTYGNGIQQLLYAWLNHLETQKPEQQRRHFAIEMESKTIISTINKNFLEYHQARKGYIWGSSGTVGSKSEIMEQFQKYGFKFVLIPPHQANIVKVHLPELFKDEAAHFNKIIKQSLKLRARNKKHVSLVFCKDIPTARRLYQAYGAKVGDKQLYEGHGNEIKAIVNTGRPGMNTITTSALGRNTNVLYDRALGMTVFQTYPDSVRGTGQKAGRTGREGSPGIVFKYFNSQDLNGLTIEQAVTAIDVNSATERAFNEELYSVLGYLLAVIDQLKDADFHQRTKKQFFREVWSQFTDEIELTYREARLNHSYIHENFAHETVRLFNQLLAKTISKNQTISIDASLVYQQVTKKSSKPIHYEVFTKPVRAIDCTPPVFIAYGFNHKISHTATKLIDKNEVKSKLAKLFTELMQGKKSLTNLEYFNYLNANAASMTIIKDAHREFLDDFLSQNIERSNTVPFVQRCLGFRGHLHKIANNQNYILMFKALANINGKRSMVDVFELKSIMVNLLEQYLKNSWFVNASRKQAVAALLKSIHLATSMNDLIFALTESQKSVMKEDTRLNTTSFWRKLKPLNYFGNSRFQNTISDIAVIMSALTQENVNARMAIELASQLDDLVKSTTLPQLSKPVPTIDELRISHAKGCFTTPSAKVLSGNLQKVLASDALHAAPTKMPGRSNFFQYKVEIEREMIEKSAEQALRV